MRKKSHNQEKINKFKFKVQLLMKFSHFLKEFSYKIRMKAQSNKIHLLLKISFQINKEVDNQQKRKLQALKVVQFKCKSKTRKKCLKVGTRKKLLNNLETILLNLRKLSLEIMIKSTLWAE